VPTTSTTARHERARLHYQLAEQVDAAPDDRERRLVRIEEYRQAAFWALAAMAPSGLPLAWPQLLLGVPMPAGAPELLTAPAPDALDDAALDRAVGTAREAATFALGLVELPERALSARVQQQVNRLVATVIASMAFIVLLAAFAPRWLERTNLATGRPWRTSSKLFDCHPEQIECGGVRTPIFFHTTFEQNPWWEVDLGPAVQFSKVVVNNRSDAVQDRAVPLVIEVGDDQKTWREVARRDEDFSVWTAKFPATTARFVRLRVPRQSTLHLEAVKVYR
jgi:hypothetical protein